MVDLSILNGCTGNHRFFHVFPIKYGGSSFFTKPAQMKKVIEEMETSLETSMGIVPQIGLFAFVNHNLPLETHNFFKKLFGDLWWLPTLW